MQIKIHLDETSSIKGAAGAIVLADDDVDMLAIFTPLDPEQTLRLCSEMADAIEQIRHIALSEISRDPRPVRS